MSFKSLIRFVLITLLLHLAASSALAQPRRFVGGIGPVDAMAFMPDNKLMLATDYLVVEFDPESQTIGPPLQVAPARMKSLVPYNDGVRVLSYSEDRMLRVWERNTGRVVAAFEWRPPASYTGTSIPTMGISPDDSLIAVALPDHETSGTQLVLLDPETLEMVVGLDEPLLDVPNPPAFSLDGRKVYFTEASQPPVWPWKARLSSLDVNTGEAAVVLTFDKGEATHNLGAVVATENGPACLDLASYWYATHDIVEGWTSFSWWNLSRVVPPSSALEIEEWVCMDQDGPGCSFYSLRSMPRDALLSPGANLAMAGEKLYGLAHSTERTLQHLALAAFSEGEQYLAGFATATASDSKHPDLLIYRTSSGEKVATIAGVRTASTIDAAILPAQNAVLTLDSDGYFRRWGIDSGTMERSGASFTVDPSSRLIVSGDESVVLVQSPEQTLLFDGMELLGVADFEHDAAFGGAAFAAGSNRLLVSSDELRQYRIGEPSDLQRVKLERTYGDPEDPAPLYGPVRFVDEDRLVIAATATGPPWLDTYDAETASRIGRDELGGSWIDFVPTPDAKRFVVRSPEGLQVYSSEDLTHPLCTLPSATEYAITRGGRILIAAGGEGVSAVDIETGTRLLSFPSPQPQPIVALAVSPTQDFIYTTNGTTILEWHFPFEALSEDAIAHVLRRLLGREEYILPADQNTDALLDAADLIVP